MLTVKRLVTLVALAILLVAQVKLPPATFDGKVHEVSKKRITIETPEGNLIDFSIARKTQVRRGEKKIEPIDLKSGEHVRIEAREELNADLTAVTITAQPEPNP